MRARGMLLTLLALEINDHARNQKLIRQGIVAGELVCNAASIAMRYPIAVLQLLGFRSQRIFAVKARQWRHDISIRKSSIATSIAAQDGTYINNNVRMERTVCCLHSREEVE